MFSPDSVPHVKHRFTSVAEYTVSVQIWNDVQKDPVTFSLPYLILVETRITGLQVTTKHVKELCTKCTR